MRGEGESQQEKTAFPLWQGWDGRAEDGEGWEVALRKGGKEAAEWPRSPSWETEPGVRGWKGWVVRVAKRWRLVGKCG